MPDLLEQGSNWLEEQRHIHMTRLVRYERGATVLDVPATIGRTEFQTVDDYGRLIRTESRDFLILASELVVGGQRLAPQRGDRVRESSGDEQRVYEVMAPAGEPVYRYSDPYRKTLRIHTKLVDTEPVP